MGRPAMGTQAQGRPEGTGRVLLAGTYYRRWFRKLTFWGAWLTHSEERATLGVRVEFKPHTGA